MPPGVARRCSDVEYGSVNVLFLTSGRLLPATRFRVLPYLAYLRRAGVTCVVRHSHPPKYEQYRWLGWRLSQRARRGWRRLNVIEAGIRNFDLAVVERELFDDDSSEIELLLRRKVPRLVLDVDDGVFLRHPQKFETLAGICDGVIAGNDALADHIRPLNSSVVVVPTSVDTARYRRSAEDPNGKPVVIGWTGTSSNLEYLRLIEAPLRRLSAEHNLELHVIADSPDPLRTMNFGRLPVRFTRWSHRNEMAQLAPFRIGVMPLRDSEWERFKCGLKLIQYLALGIPAVASPVGVNPQIVSHGVNGMLATTESDWEDALRGLIGDAALRTRIGAAGRQTVESHYSIQANAPRLEQALRRMAQRE